MKVYTAGPMTGIPQFNFPAFDEAAAYLRGLGYEVVSPAELDDPVDRAAALASPDGSALSYGTGVKKTWGAFLARDVKLIADDGIEAVFCLPGWEKSRGARLETFVAFLCGVPIYVMRPNGIGYNLAATSLGYLLEAWGGMPLDAHALDLMLPGAKP